VETLWQDIRYGARRETVLWMVLRETLLLVLFGFAAGVPAAIGGARIIRACCSAWGLPTPLP
jgi:ABC-type antimicrobial peptide transport system permease subunit